MITCNGTVSEVIFAVHQRHDAIDLVSPLGIICTATAAIICFAAAVSKHIRYNRAASVLLFIANVEWFGPQRCKWDPECKALPWLQRYQDHTNASDVMPADFI